MVYGEGQLVSFVPFKFQDHQNAEEDQSDDDGVTGVV